MGIEGIIRAIFRSYYRNPDREIEIPDIERREIAYQPFGKEVMIRHLAFSSVDEFRRFIVKNTPSHVYYSTARYRDPGNPDMERKGWLNADIVFDIDGDHLPTEGCRLSEESGAVCIECLDDARHETLKLVDLLENDLGLSESEYSITFSGHRGFHVHVESGPLLELGQDERRELVDYVRAVGFSIERFLDMRGRLVAGPDMDGVGSRIWRCIENVLDERMRSMVLGLRSVRKYVSRIRRFENSVASCLAVMIDEIVTLDIKRLIRVPNSLHGKTGLIVSRLSKQDLEKDALHIVELSVPRMIRGKRMRIVLRKRLAVRNVLGEDIDPDRIDESQEVSTYVGVYLIRRGLADPVEE
ncbi:MAG: DNA primase catalytic subunit PriS [Crenarchaeota archaeon]|nr:DNA primase catalytic subunit PriS [Thermoproteota archaeon]